MSKLKIFSLLTVLLFTTFSLFSQIRDISGTVLDQTGNPLPGVSIVVKGTVTGTTTDVNGNFTIKVDKGETLAFSYIGYDAQDVTINSNKKLKITMVESSIAVDEVVVVGYGTQSKRTVTSAISKVSGKELQGAPINSLGDGLKGKISGARVYTTNNTPGADPTFLVRGGSSISRDNSPLILVDGIERSIAGINPNDIQSIEVLKDAASSAIYGSRASNGVVLITTKQGTTSQKPKITFEVSMAQENTERIIERLNSEQAITLMRKRLSQGPHSGYLKDDNSAYSSGNTATSIYSTRYLNDGESVPAGYQSMIDPLDPTKTLIFQDNDWNKKSFKSALWQNYYVGVEAGSDRVRYSGSVGYVKDAGVGVGTNFSRFSARSNTDVNILKNLKFTANVDFNQTLTNAYASQFQILTRGLMTPTTQKLYYDAGPWEGTPTPGYNASSPTPVFYAYYNDNDEKINRLGLSGALDWKFLKYLRANVQTSLFTSANTFDSFMRANVKNGTRDATSNLTDEQRKKVEAYLAYDQTFAESHTLSALVGYSYQKYNYKYLQSEATGANSDKIPTLNAEPTKVQASTIKNEEVLIGYFGRLLYDYQKKYMFMFTFRQDASSRFYSGHQWGFFPGASIGWVMSEEPFMANQKTITNLKWRASYGQTGNNSIGYYDAQGQYQISTKYEGISTIIPTSMPNANLSWETSTQLDLGFDLGLCKNRIQLNADYFNKETDNLITEKVLPNTSGFNKILTNIGKVRFYGFDIELNTHNIKTKDFFWDSKLVYSYVRNKVLKLPYNGRAKNRIGGYAVKMSDGTVKEFGGIAEGEKLGRFYGNKTAYIISTQDQVDNALYDESSNGWDWQTKSVKGVGKKALGDYEWKDLNGDGRINGNDMYYLGTTIPHTTGGFNNTFSYKNLSLSIYFDWALGHSVSNNMLQRQMCNFFANNTSLPKEVLKCWDPELGQDVSSAKYARFGGNDSDDLNKNFRSSSNVFTTKGDYLCLRDISLQYSLDKNVLKKTPFSNITISLSGNNLHYFTKVIGMSPEVGTANAYSGSFYTYPPIRKFVLGIRVTL